MKSLRSISKQSTILLVIGLILFTAILVSLEAWWSVGNYPDKLWLHRANSIEKWQEMADLYPNAEIDVIIRPDHTLDVTHDDSISFGQKVDHYIAKMAKRGGNLWLDVKNLTPSSALILHHRLDSMLTKYNVDRQRLIVEGNNTDALGYLTHEGHYFTSFYVHYPNPSRLSDAEIKSVISHLCRVVDSGNVCALSFPICWYDVIHSQLDRSIPMLTWDNHILQWTFLLLPWKRALINDPQIKVILLKRKGSFHR